MIAYDYASSMIYFEFFDAPNFVIDKLFHDCSSFHSIIYYKKKTGNQLSF